MIVLKAERGDYDVRLTRDELWLLGQALNEVCNGIEILETEFQTRLGYERSVARELMDHILDTAGSNLNEPD